MCDQDEDKVEERGLSPDTSETDSLQSGTSGGSGDLLLLLLLILILLLLLFIFIIGGLFPGDVGGQGRRKSSVCPQPLLPQATLLRSEGVSGACLVMFVSIGISILAICVLSLW